MKKVKVLKNSFTLPNSTRVVRAGEYDEGFFSSEEIAYLVSIGSIKKTVATPKKVVKVQKKEEVEKPKFNLEKKKDQESNKE